MSDSTITRPGATGSISGFDTFSTDQSGTPESVVPSYASRTLTYEALLALRADLDPVRLNALAATINTHLANENNPHQDNETNIGIDVFTDLYVKWQALGNVGTVSQFAAIIFQNIGIATLEDILNNNGTALVNVTGANELIAYHNADDTAHAALIAEYFPGQVPSANPVYCMMARIGTPDINAINSATTPTTYIDPSGTLCTAPAGTLAVDYLTGVPLFSLWDTRTNLLSDSDPITAGGSLTGFTSVTNDPQTLAPDRNTACLLLSDVNGVLGTYTYSINIDLLPNTEYTDSIFFNPKTNVGYSYITINATTHPVVAPFVVQLRFNHADNTITAITSNIVTYVYALPNGWYRIGIQYITPGTATSFSPATLSVIYSSSIISLSYSGTGVQIMAIYGFMHAAGPGVSPYIPTTIGPVTSDPTVLTITPIGSQVPNPTNGIFVLSYLQSKSLSTFNRTLIESSDNNFSIKTTGTVIEGSCTEVGGDIVTAQTIVAYDSQTVTHTAFSYSSTNACILTSNQNRVNSPGIYNPINSTMAEFILGPLDGYLDTLTIYPVSDQGTNLEFVAA